MKNYIIYFILIVGFCGCKKTEDKYHVMPVSEELKSYMAVGKKGSYFIYQDTVTGQKDTFTITDYIEAYNPMLCQNTIDGKPASSLRVQYEVKTTFTKRTFHVYINSDCTKDNYATVDFNFGGGGVY